MTNAELLAKIKAEIERLKSIEYPCDNSQQATGFFNALNRMTDFLSTLEEKSEIPNDLEEAANEYANKHYSEWDESWDDYNGHNIEPENDKLQLMDAFIAGAKWMSIHGNDIKEL